jgi:hypothetical protein
MYFESSITINRPPYDVFAFLRDKDKYPQKENSPVRALEQTTVGEPNVGTQYREVIRIVPFLHFEILSEITRFEPGKSLEEDFHSGVLKGHLAYEFIAEGAATRCIQRQTFSMIGFLRVFEPLIELMFTRQMQKRLETIKSVLEGGWKVA